MPLARPSACLGSLLLHAGAALLFTAALLHGLGVRFTLTPSVPVGLYQYTDEEPRLGGLATFCPPDEAATLALERGYLHRGRCPAGSEPLGKYVLALEGDTVDVRPEWLHVNGHPIPNSAVLWRDRLGRELLHIPFGKHVVGADSLFMFSGHHRLSFDSRYFGPVPRTSVISVARPLWTSQMKPGLPVSPARRFASPPSQSVRD